MCAIGHHDAPDRPKRRHIGNGGMVEAVKATPRETLIDRRKKLHAQMQAEREAERNGMAVPGLDFEEQFEPVAPGADLLLDVEPSHDPRQWWRDRD